MAFGFQGKSLDDILAGAPGRAGERGALSQAPVARGPRGRQPLWSVIGEAPPTGWVLAQFAQEAGQEPSTEGAPPERVLVPVDVPGVGRTYFDPEVAPRVKDFIDQSREAGINVIFNSGFRTTAKQGTLQGDPHATTPARPGNSLHEAGRAFDIDGNAAGDQLGKLVEIGKQVGLGWGGDFRTPDPGHFFVEVPEGITNRAPRIQRAQDYYRQLQQKP